MQTPNTLSSTLPRGISAVRFLAVAIVILLALTAVVYAASPWLIGHAAQRLAATQGYNLVLELQHPGWRGVHVLHLDLRDPDLHVEAARINVSYRPTNLLKGELDKIDVGTLTVTSTTHDTTTQQSAPAQHVSASPLEAITSLLDSLPAAQTHVPDLTVRAPDLSFAATGSAHITRQQAEINLTGISPTEASNFRVQLQAARDNTLSLNFAGHDNRHFLKLTAAAVADTLQLHAELNLRGLALDLVAHALDLPEGNGHIAGLINVEAPTQISTQPTATYINEIEASATAVHISWQSAGADRSTPAQDTGSLQVDLTASEVELSGGALSGAVRGEVVYTLEEYKAVTQLPDDFSLRFAHNMLTTTRLPISLSGPDITALLSGGLQVSTTTPLMANLSGDLQVDTSSGNSTGTVQTQLVIPDAAAANSPQLTGAVSLQGHMRIDTYPFAYTLSAEFTVDERSDVDSSGLFTLGPQISLPFQLSHAPDDAKGKLTVTGPVRWQNPLLASITPAWPSTQDSPTGKLHIDAQAHWHQQQPLEAALTMNLEQADAQVDDMILRGLQGTFEIRSDDVANSTAWQLHPTLVQAALLDPGVPLTNFRTQLSGNLTTLSASNSSAQLLGGNLQIDKATYNTVQGNGDLTVVLSNLDLAEVLALEGEHISGNGSLSGTLPIRIRNNEITVSAGTISAQPPLGKIKLSPELTAPTGRAELDFALKALEDFSFTRLESGIDYQANGDLLLTVNLLGTNPDFERGRAVNYNLQVGENIPALLESLRIQDTFTRKIENAVQR